MASSKPLEGTEPTAPQSGAELTLTLRGMLERMKDGDRAAEANLKHLLNALTGSDREKWEERCPEAILRIRMALLKLGSEEERKAIDHQLARERLELDRKKAETEIRDDLPPVPEFEEREE